MFEQAFRNLDDVLRHESGCSTELDYEAKIKRMDNAGRNGGEYYTPRPLIRAMIQVIKPQIGERVL